MKPEDRKPTLRCAIYTRVSTDSGLEQEFNSLDNQREASEAYIKSQAHEGWKLIRDRFDDGGYSGGSMDRPALQTLLDEVRAKRIDVIVVYKVDRLTRSLADFAKLVELFDAHGVSFVSVTQSFNTTTSMGRLTLNVLLSFAQFEREVTGERIRDKIAASKKRGIWMGGVVPLGYRVEDRALHVVEAHAEVVRDALSALSRGGQRRPAQAAARRRERFTPPRTSGRAERRAAGLFRAATSTGSCRTRSTSGGCATRGKSTMACMTAIVDPETGTKSSNGSLAKPRPRATPQPDDLSFLAGKLFDDRGQTDGRELCLRDGRDVGGTTSRERHWPVAARTRDRSRAFPRRKSKAKSWMRSGSILRPRRDQSPHKRKPATSRRTLASSNPTGSRTNRRIPTSPSSSPTSGDDARDAIARVTLGAMQIEIQLRETLLADGQDRIVTIPWVPQSTRRRREIIEGVDPATPPIRAMRPKARDYFVRAVRDAHRWLDELLQTGRTDRRFHRGPRRQERALDPVDAFPRVPIPDPRKGCD